MNKHKRNLDGLRNASHKKHIDMINRSNNTIDELVKKNVPLTIVNVAKMAGVSRAWVYRQPILKEKINKLRDAQAQSSHEIAITNSESMRSSIELLKEKLKKLNIQNSKLRHQVEIMYGRYHCLKKSGDLIDENDDLF